MPMINMLSFITFISAIDSVVSEIDLRRLWS